MLASEPSKRKKILESFYAFVGDGVYARVQAIKRLQEALPNGDAFLSTLASLAHLEEEVRQQ